RCPVEQHDRLFTCSCRFELTKQCCCRTGVHHCEIQVHGFDLLFVVLDPIDRTGQIAAFRRCFWCSELLCAFVQRFPVRQAGADFFHVVWIPPVFTCRCGMATQLNHASSLPFFHHAGFHCAFP